MKPIPLLQHLAYRECSREGWFSEVGTVLRSHVMMKAAPNVADEDDSMLLSAKDGNLIRS
jgi:hypothetical protein